MPRKQFALLLVEDNADHAVLIQRSFEQHQLPITIHHFFDGAAVLDYLDNRQAPTYCRPDLILLDLRLPKVDGLEVLKSIKADQDLHYIPVVILTSSEAERDIANAYDLNVNSYLVKPADFSSFSQLIHDLSHYWLTWNHHP